WKQLIRTYFIPENINKLLIITGKTTYVVSKYDRSVANRISNILPICFNPMTRYTLNETIKYLYTYFYV
ncbi:MAG: hypothetical protein OEY49_06725, partial [Candidatus Heimdallarchaeota archaeon]|nr:hypothetical protein [Candidatus Heimdallarchaeota archaeon]